MTIAIKQSTTTYPLIFLMVDDTDHVTGKTGLTPTVTISKAGGAFASPAGAVTEIANGWYKVAGNATDNATLGPLILHATGAAADPVDVVYNVTASLLDDVTPQVEDILADTDDLFMNQGNWVTATGFATPTNITAATGITLAAVTHTGAVIPTVTTLTGHTPQTGDSFARLTGTGAVTLASLAVTGATTYTGLVTKSNGELINGGAQGDALILQATTTGAGLNANGAGNTHAGIEAYGDFGPGIYAEGGPYADAHGIWAIGGTGQDGFRADGDGAGVGFRATGGIVGALTGNITGNLSGSVGSVTGLTAADVGAIKTKTDYLPSATAGSAGGVMIAGSNAATTLASLTVSGATTLTGNVSAAAGITVTQSTTNGHGLSVTGNGTGNGILATSGSGATGDGIKTVSQATAGNGFMATGPATGTGATFEGGAGIWASGTAGHGFYASGGGANHGIYARSGSGATGDGIRAKSFATAGNGMYLEGSGAAGDGFEAVAGGGVPIRGNLTGNITGDLSGSVGSVTGNVGGNVTGTVASVVGAVGSVTAAVLLTSGTGTGQVALASGIIDANVQKINDVTITGDGQSGTEFGV